ncbi:Clavaminate synthase-like protein [Rhizodiscina lignyota]|uniref:Clavaminate synthase-like protein n=1 Tax=Rhizodiscina lignyota TaxID=1504668 RepID=A0A9P4ICC7_9PEZI|nr:Clavaminate synthase-like protein [Rhizodiscina lignyota]
MGGTSTANGTSPIPVIDFDRFLHGSSEEKKATAKQVDDAFHNVGFVYIKNHGIPQEQVDKCFDWSAKFFALPTEKKMLCPHPPGGSHHRGYSGMDVEKVSQNIYDRDEIDKIRTAIPDTKESFESGSVSDSYQPNIWPPPDVIPGFQPFMESFYLRCAALVHDVLRCLATALGMDPEALSDTHSEDLFQLRLLHYPSVPAKVLKEKERTRISAHSDFGTITLLFQDKVGGLEVEDQCHPGQFKPAPPVEGTCLVNIGDLMERWTNGRWKSTVHRVGEPPIIDGDMCMPRYSIPFFSVANLDTIIDALPGCWDEVSNPKKHETVTAGGYVQMRMEALY